MKAQEVRDFIESMWKGDKDIEGVTSLTERCYVDLDEDPATEGLQSLERKAAQCRNFLNLLETKMLRVIKLKNMVDKRVSYEEAILLSRQETALLTTKIPERGKHLQEATVNGLPDVRMKIEEVRHWSSLLRDIITLQSVLKLRSDALYKTIEALNLQYGVVKQRIGINEIGPEESSAGSKPYRNEVKEFEEAVPDVVEGQNSY